MARPTWHKRDGIGACRGLFGTRDDLIGTSDFNEGMRDEERKQSGLSIFLFIHPSALIPHPFAAPSARVALKLLLISFVKDH